MTDYGNRSNQFVLNLFKRNNEPNNFKIPDLIADRNYYFKTQKSKIPEIRGHTE